MRVTQLGCGICGLVCAEHLAKYEKVEQLTLADANVDAANILADKLKSSRVSVVKIDGTDQKAVKGLLKKTDIVVATMPWRLNRMVMQTAAEVGTDYVDFGMPFDSTGPEYDEYHKLCKDAGISALVGMGEEPGMSDVFAMHAASKLDRAEEAHVYDGDTGTVEGLEFFSLWSPIDLLDETSVPAAVFREGKIEFIPPLSSRQIFNFPQPLGPLPVYKTNHDETYFMPLGIKTLRNASFNICIDDKFAEASALFRRWGLLSKEPVNVKGVKVKPQDVVAAMLPPPVKFADKVKGHTGFVVEVSGTKGGNRTVSKMWTTMAHEEAYKGWRTNAGAYYVGTGGAVATEMLIDGEVKDKGIVIPEQLPTESFLRRLAEKHVKIQEEVRTL